MTALILDHLWQSTIFAGGAWLLTLALHDNGAKTRFWVWFAASIKFLIPFAALTALGRYFLAPLVPRVSAPVLLLMSPAAQPFSTQLPSSVAIHAVPHVDAPHTTAAITSLLLLAWALGFCLIMARWLRRQYQLQRLAHDAVKLPLLAPLPVKSAPSMLEPGLVGIWRPVILLPNGIAERLSGAEMDAIIAHELCHWRRRDNLLAAAHMLVEALFWFHPLVWWIGKRLNAERESACDENVLADGTPPQVYVESILKVCRFYLHSPLDCAAGVSGANLKQRLEEIVENKLVHRLKNTKKALLATAALLAVGAPVILGLVRAPTAQAQSSVPVAKEKFGPIQRPNTNTGPSPKRLQMVIMHSDNDGKELSPLAVMMTADTCNKDQPTHCTGNVALSVPAGLVTGDAVDVEGGKITLKGNVVMFVGRTHMNGALLTMVVETGVMHMNGQDVKSGFPGSHLVMGTPVKTQPDK